MRPRDTTPKAYALQLEILRSMTPAERFRSAMELSDFTHKLAEAGLRHRRPDCTDANIHRRMAESLYGVIRR